MAPDSSLKLWAWNQCFLCSKEFVDRMYCCSCLRSSDSAPINVTCPAGGRYHPAVAANPTGTCLWPALTSALSSSAPPSPRSPIFLHPLSHHYSLGDSQRPCLVLMPPVSPKTLPTSANLLWLNMTLSRAWVQLSGNPPSPRETVTRRKE